MKIGLIGLGIMGRPMARNLLHAGFDLTVWNRTAATCAPLVEEGAWEAASPAEVSRNCDVVITIVGDTSDVEAVLFGPEGVFEGIGPGKVVIDMSTISPEATERFAARLAEQGADMLDAPVSGGDSGAVEGRLAIMVGGKEAVFRRCLPIFEAMGEHVVHMGPHGAGQRTKLANQVICALNLLATAEGIEFARAAGLDPAKVLSVVTKGAAASWMLENLGPRMIARDWRPGFFIRLQDKDMRLVREAVAHMGLKLAGSELAASLFAKANRRGLGDEGTQALIKVIE